MREFPEVQGSEIPLMFIYASEIELVVRLANALQEAMSYAQEHVAKHNGIPEVEQQIRDWDQLIGEARQGR